MQEVMKGCNLLSNRWYAHVISSFNSNISCCNLLSNRWYAHEHIVTSLAVGCCNLLSNRWYAHVILKLFRISDIFRNIFVKKNQYVKELF